VQVIILPLGVSLVVGVILWRRKVTDVPDRWRIAFDAAEVLFVAVGVLYVGYIAFRNVVDPNTWDFPVFYTVARNAVSGVSFYDPVELTKTFVAAQAEYGFGSDFLLELGFWYAPPTGLVLAPLGLPSYAASLTLNYVIQGAFFVGSLVWMHRTFPLRKGWMGLIEMTALCLAFRPVLEAFRLGQIVFGALFMTVVAASTIRTYPWIAGVALGFGSVFKHLLLVPAILSLAMKKWRVTAGAIVAVLVSGVLAAIAFGPRVYIAFVDNGPSERPAELALDGVIESLNAVLRRALNDIPNESGALDAILYPPYLAVAALLTVVTLVAVYRARSDRFVEVGFAAILLLSLVAYPNTLFNTLPLMLPAIVVTLAMSDRLPFDARWTVAVVVAQFGVVAGHAQLGFLSMVIGWTYLIVCLLWSPVGEDADQLAGAAAGNR
jgi:hypothetical protein